MKDTELEKHIRNIRFNANKWEDYIKEFQKTELQIKGLQNHLQEIKTEIRIYSKKTRGLARMEII